MTYAIDLPWPDKDLSQNARVHWSQRAKAVKAARTAAAWLVRAGIPRRPDWKAVALSVVFHPPNRRRFDRDGLIGRMKALQDGIADAIGVDDRHFIPTYAMGEPVKGGLVRVSLSQAHPVIVERVK